MTESDLAIPRLSRAGSLAEQVRDSIFDAIVSGQLAPGARLREIPLSDHFGLSKTPVREALRLLEADGLVEVTPRRGAVVTSFGDEAIRNLYELRLVLEIAAVRRAAESGQPPTRAEDLKAEMDAAIDEQSPVRFHHLDVQFHRAIAELSGNPELAKALAHTHQRIQAVRVRVQVPGRLQSAQKQHERILSAVRRGRADAAEKAVTDHLISARDHVLRFIGQ